MIESVLNKRERVAEMPIFVMKLRRFIGRKSSDLNIDNKFCCPTKELKGWF